MNRRENLPRALLLLLALAFLFETWIWAKAVAAGQRLAALIRWAEIKVALTRVIDRLPAWVVVLLFGVPFVVAESGAAVCVFFAATGHIVAGSVGYVAVKILGFGLVVPIFDLTREKLLALPWFAYLYEKLLAFHQFAQRLVAPYREAAIAFARRLRDRARAYWSRRLVGTEDEVG